MNSLASVSRCLVEIFARLVLGGVEVRLGVVLASIDVYISPSGCLAFFIEIFASISLSPKTRLIPFHVFSPPLKFRVRMLHVFLATWFFFFARNDETPGPRLLHTEPLYEKCL